MFRICCVWEFRLLSPLPELSFHDEPSSPRPYETKHMLRRTLNFVSQLKFKMKVGESYEWFKEQIFALATLMASSFQLSKLCLKTGFCRHKQNIKATLWLLQRTYCRNTDILGLTSYNFLQHLLLPKVNSTKQLLPGLDNCGGSQLHTPLTSTFSNFLIGSQGTELRIFEKHFYYYTNVTGQHCKEFENSYARPMVIEWRGQEPRQNDTFIWWIGWNRRTETLTLYSE